MNNENSLSNFNDVIDFHRSKDHIIFSGYIDGYKKEFNMFDCIIEINKLFGKSKENIEIDKNMFNSLNLNLKNILSDQLINDLNKIDNELDWTNLTNSKLAQCDDNENYNMSFKKFKNGYFDTLKFYNNLFKSSTYFKINNQLMSYIDAIVKLVDHVFFGSDDLLYDHVNGVLDIYKIENGYVKENDTEND